MIKSYLVIISFFISTLALAQAISNGSFENPTSPCPAGISVLSNATDWSDPYINPPNPGDTCSTSDLFNTCDLLGALGTGVPANILGNQAPHSGNGYAGIIAYTVIPIIGGDDGWREYVQNRMTAPLVANEEYCLSVWVSLADQSSQAISNFGVKFTTNQIAVNCPGVSNSVLSANGFPADVNYTGGIVNNSTGWTLLQFNYTASGGEQYVTFGNFAPVGTVNAQSTGVSISAAGDGAYYYIDDMSITQGTCCSAIINPQSDLCSVDAPITLTGVMMGGTWSGTGISNPTAGTFDPSVAGVGSHTITYTLPCGDAQTIDIVVTECLEVCLEANGDFTASNGTAPYTWSNSSTAQDCSGCPGGNCIPFVCTGVTVTNWTPFGNGTTITPSGSFPIQVEDANGLTFEISSTGALQACAPTSACDSTIDPFGPFCTTDAASNLTVTTPGGTWSGTGITDANAGTFDPATSSIGTNTLTYTLPCGSINTVEVLVNTCGNPEASFTTSNTTLCEGDCIDFTNQSTGVGSTATYSWSFTGSSTATSSDQNPTNICYPAIGTYEVSLTVTDNGNTDDTTITSYITVGNCSGVTVDFTPSDATICQEGCITFTNNSSGSGIANYGWDFQGGTPANHIGPTPPQVCFDNPGNYVVTLVAADASNNPLGSKDTLIVVEPCIIPTPTVNFTVSRQNLCEEECVNFTDQSFGIVGSGTYNWSFPGALTPTSNVQNPSNICYPAIGTYTVSLAVTDNNGTGDTTMTALITVSECDPPVPSFSISNNNICIGSCIDFTNNSTNSDSYEWIFNGGFPSGSTDANPTNICYNTIGEFDVILVATNTFTTDTLIQTVTVSEPPFLEISDDVTIFQGTNTVLSIETDGVSYIWSPVSSLSCEDCLSTAAEPDSTTLYNVVVTAQNGCALTAQVLVTVVSVDAIGIPSGFSPNGDLVNDILFVEGAGIEKMNLNIYNRYGQKIFESSDQDVGWDGTFKGKEQNPGVFAYTLEYVLGNGETGILKGNVTLVK